MEVEDADDCRAGVLLALILEKISVSLLPQKTRGKKEDITGSVFETCRGKEVANAARLGEAARKGKLGSKDLKEEVNRQQDAITRIEKVSSVLLASMERKQKLREWELPKKVKRRSLGT